MYISVAGLSIVMGLGCRISGVKQASFLFEDALSPRSNRDSTLLPIPKDTAETVEGSTGHATVNPSC